MNGTSPDATPSAPNRERPSVVLGAAAAVLVLAGAIGWMSHARARPLDRAQTVDTWFAPRELPFEFQFAQAERLARGDEIVRFERPGLPPEPEKAAPAEPNPETSPETSPETKAQQPPFDWGAIDFGETGAPPREFVIARLPLERAKSDLEALFKGGFEFDGDWRSIGRDGGKRIVGRGLARWGALDCAYVLEREFEAGGTFCDTARVNLSRAREPMLLIARFGRGVAGSLAPIEALLASLEPR